METIKKISISDLCPDSVVVMTREYVNINGQEIQLGDTTSVCYNNCPYDRKRMQAALPEQYRNAVLAVWGETATLEDPKRE